MGIDPSLSDTHPLVFIHGNQYRYGRVPEYGHYLVENTDNPKDYWAFEERQDLEAFLINLPESARHMERIATAYPDWDKVSDEQRSAYLKDDLLKQRAKAAERLANGTASPFNTDLDGEHGPHALQSVPSVARVLRDTTRNLVEAILLDVWPRAGAIVDFGLDSQEHYEAIYYPLREGEIAPEQLDAALAHGAELTRLVRSAPSNPHREIIFRTGWDLLRESPEPENGAPTGQFEVWQDRGWPQSRLDQMLGGAPPSRLPEAYVHVANVQAESLEQAVLLTTDTGHLLRPDGDPPWQPWYEKEGVQALLLRPYVRDTDAGDVIVDPQGKAYRYDGKGFSEISRHAEQPIPSPSQIAREPTVAGAGREVRDKDNGHDR